MSFRDLNLAILVALFLMGCAFAVAGYTYHPLDLLGTSMDTQ